MNKHIIIFVLLFATHISNAQNINLKNNASLGFHLHQYQRDFGMGLNFASPYFLNNKMAVRLRGNLVFNEHIENEETIWSPYWNATLGLIGIAGYVTENIRLYSEGGIIGLFPSSSFSSEAFVFGGYGLFGFEFYMAQTGNYFIEIGAVGTGASADNVPLDPIYSNGLLISTGFRFHLN